MRLFPCVGAICLGAAAAAGGLVLMGRWAQPVEPPVPSLALPLEAPVGSLFERGAWVLRGSVQVTRIDPARLRVVARPMAIDEAAQARFTALDARGRFELVGLEDTDYRIEVVAIDAPERVLGRAEFVRPGGDELLLTIDPRGGPARHPGSLARDP